MWTKNGARFLYRVLERIDRVIPREVVHRKIMIDDESTDKTREIGVSFGWEVYHNQNGGVASAANQALSLVDCEYFISFEQDLLLSHDWWDVISDHVKNPDVIVACWIRYPTESTLTVLEKFSVLDYSFTLNNTIFKTEVIRNVGGFPSNCDVCVDSNLCRKLRALGYKFLIDTSIVSQHIRTTVKDHCQHLRAQMRQCRCRRRMPSPIYFLRLCITSSYWAVRMFHHSKNKKILSAYPRIRIYALIGVLERR
jgi:glycosyltransferase involved in cell wall biosynthesis